MKKRNIIGKVFFFGMGLFLTIMVFYPQALDYFYLTNREPKPFNIWGQDGAILSLAFIFVFGGARFIKISDFLIDKFSVKNNSNAK